MAADTANVPASTKNGSENATASRNPPSGGPMKELVTISAPQRRPLAFSRLSLLDDRGHQGLGGVVPQNLRHAEQEWPRRKGRRGGTRPAAGGSAWPAAINSGLDSSDWKARTANAQPTVTTALSASMATTSRRRSTRSVITPAGKTEYEPWQPGGDTDQCDVHRVAGDGTRQPWIGDAGDPVSEIGNDAGDPQSPVVEPQRLRHRRRMVR